MTDVLVIGGGLAGAAAATRLARAGRAVTLLEREPGPHDKVCGEFLSFEAVASLRALGLAPERLGAVPIDGVSMSRGGCRHAARLPFEALSLSRRRLDQALLDLAAEAGVRVRRGVRAVAMEPGPPWRVAVAGGETLEAGAVLLATGKHDLRGWKRPPGRQPDLIGFKQHWRLTPDQRQALSRQVELHLFPGGYAGLEPVEDGDANLCLVVRQRTFSALGSAWPALLAHIRATAPRLAERLGGGLAVHERPLAIAAIPYGLVAKPGDGVWRLGDQAAVIPSFAGEGMAIALASAELAATTLIEGGSAADYQARLASRLRGQVGLATLISQCLVRPWGQAGADLVLSLRPTLLATVARDTRLRQAGQDEMALRDGAACVGPPRSAAQAG